MAAFALEFEKPILELEQKVEELREFSQQHDVDVSHGIHLLMERIDEAKAKVFSRLTPWQRVQLARHPKRPYPQDYIDRIFPGFLELHGDRQFADDKALFGGLANFGSRSCMVLGTRKGRELKENIRVNFGSAFPEGYRKARRLMKLAEKARVPIVSLIDTPGAFPGIASEERHVGEAIAVNLMEMFRLTVPVIVVILGEGGSGGALGIGIGNRVLIMENAYFSVISPEGCASILWRDGAMAEKAAEALKITSPELLELGLVDGIVPEPLGGAHVNHDKAAESLRLVLEKCFAELDGMDGEALRSQRAEKYRHMGVVADG
ncbi:MAG: acetyl-CoA carboxylase carboxyltransferase subunit alpha [Lentisphaeria bacterium]|nr:acetyl-CoA carboxylase carboxyltransferase subunit alpha [Lentisphaeria bacterium]